MAQPHAGNMDEDTRVFHLHPRCTPQRIWESVLPPAPYSGNTDSRGAPSHEPLRTPSQPSEAAADCVRNIEMSVASRPSTPAPLLAVAQDPTSLTTPVDLRDLGIARTSTSQTSDPTQTPPSDACSLDNGGMYDDMPALVTPPATPIVVSFAATLYPGEESRLEQYLGRDDIPLENLLFFLKHIQLCGHYGVEPQDAAPRQWYGLSNGAQDAVPLSGSLQNKDMAHVMYTPDGGSTHYAFYDMLYHLDNTICGEANHAQD